MIGASAPSVPVPPTDPNATDKQSGTESLLAFWDNNYFSFFHGETREMTARFFKKDAGTVPESQERR